MKCAKCDIDYPDNILSQMNLNGKYTGPICGICALELSNELHGTNRTEFDGEFAEQFRQQAIAHRLKEASDG